jgi:SPP1 family predicted phage head-tail adaptor
MRIGEMRKQVSIEVEQPTTDNAGGYALGWTTLATVWAQITPVSGNEVYTAQHLEGHVTHHVLMRYRDDVTSDMRLSYNSRVFNIHAVLNTGERNQWTVLLVEEGSAV